MANCPLPSIETLRQLLRYNPETGRLYWVRTRKRAFSGKTSHGYNSGRYKELGDKFLYAHRVIWAVVHGVWPDGLIDHKDGDRQNNRIKNLRVATPLQNKVNCKPWSKTGMKGCYLQPSGNWAAIYSSGGKKYRIGTFGTKEEANAAYMAKAREMYGEFASG